MKIRTCKFIVSFVMILFLVFAFFAYLWMEVVFKDSWSADNYGPKEKLVLCRKLAKPQPKEISFFLHEKLLSNNALISCNYDATLTRWSFDAEGHFQRRNIKTKKPSGFLPICGCLSEYKKEMVIAFEKRHQSSNAIVLIFFDLTSFLPKKQWDIIGVTIKNMAYDDSGEYLAATLKASLGKSERIRIWNLSNPEKYTSIKFTKDFHQISTLAPCRKGFRIVGLDTQSRTISVYGVSNEESYSQKSKQLLKYTDERRWKASFSSNGEKVALAAKYPNRIDIKIFSSKTGDLQSHFLQENNSIIGPAIFSPDSLHVLCRTNNGMIIVWDTQTKEIAGKYGVFFRCPYVFWLSNDVFSALDKYFLTIWRLN